MKESKSSKIDFEFENDDNADDADVFSGKDVIITNCDTFSDLIFLLFRLLLLNFISNLAQINQRLVNQLQQPQKLNEKSQCPFLQKQELTPWETKKSLTGNVMLRQMPYNHFYTKVFFPLSFKQHT